MFTRMLSEEALPDIEVEPGFHVSGFFDFGSVESPAWLVLLFLLGVVAVIVLPIVLFSIVHAKRTGEKFVFTTRDLVYGSICLAMSYVLSFFGISLNLGGTITFASILPVTIYSYYFGFRKGAMICTAYMLLQLTQSPFIVSPWSMLLDYLIPYFALSLSGAFSFLTKKRRAANGKKRVALASHLGYYIGMTLYIAVRYTSHILSGILFWDLWYGPAPAAFVVGYSFAYNSFCLIDFAIAVAASLALLASRTFDKLMTGVTHGAKTAKKQTESSEQSASSEQAATVAPVEPSKQSANGSVTAQTDGLTHSDPGAEHDDRA